MRVLFCAFPATAHVHPIVPLAWALQNAGHEVRVAIHPGATHLITEAGLGAVPVGEALTEIMEWNDNFAKLDMLTDFLSVDAGHDDGWAKKWAGMTRMLAGFSPMLDDLVDFCRDWQPDLVLWDPFCVPAAVAATVTGAAQARFLWGQDNIGWLRARSRERLEREGGEDPVPALMQPMVEPYGIEYRDDLLLGQWSLDPVLPPLRLPVDLSYEPLRRVPYNGNRVPPRWLHKQPDRPRVCLSLGMGGRGRQLFREAGVSFADVVHSLAELDIELIATLHAEQLASVRDVPGNVRLLEYVPLNYLLPSCSVLVHHGGGGTFAAAVAHRVRQLVTPLPMWGEGTTARYLAESGAGIMVEPKDLTLDVLRDQVSRLLTEPSFTTGTERLYVQMRAMPSPEETVRRLEALTEENRPQRRAITL